jgi:hypothetical protein
VLHCRSHRTRPVRPQFRLSQSKRKISAHEDCKETRTVSFWHVRLTSGRCDQDGHTRSGKSRSAPLTATASQGDTSSKIVGYSVRSHILQPI